MKTRSLVESHFFVTMKGALGEIASIRLAWTSLCKTCKGKDDECERVESLHDRPDGALASS